MGFLGLTCIYLTRTNLTVAIVDMINSTSSTTAPSSMESLFRSSMLFSDTSSSAYANGTCYDEESGAANQVIKMIHKLLHIAELLTRRI